MLNFVFPLCIFILQSDQILEVGPAWGEAIFAPLGLYHPLLCAVRVSSFVDQSTY